MTTLIAIAIVLLFSLCVYIESSYRYIRKSAMRKTDESPTPVRKKIGAIVVGFLFTVGMWIGVSVLILIPIGLMQAFNDEYYLLYERYEVLWWTLIAILEISILWSFYLQGLIKRSKQINFGNQMHSFGFKFASKNSLIFMLWILFLMIVPYVTMNVTHGAIWPSTYSITPDKYEHNNTIMSQILQEVANTNAAVRSEIRYFADRLYKTMLTGITSTTVVLGLLIFYRTHKSEKDE